MPQPPPPARREAAIVALLTLVGAILRFWGPGRLGLNHFDEGIYALAGLWVQSPKGIAGITPEVVAYAPPLYPMLVGVAYLMLGVSDVSAILVSQVAGVLTIPAIAWVGRRTFGPGAGAAAAAFVALSGPHVAFSRTALTDSTFLLCWVLTLGFGGRFLERPGVLRALPFGLMVGLAQNAKYNGYLAGGIVALTALWGLIAPTPEGRRTAVLAMGYGLIAAIVAGLVYWPWFRFVEDHGGYSALLRHHRSYLSGPSAWLPHWRLQMNQAAALAGPIHGRMSWGLVSWAAAWIGANLASGPAGAAASSRRWRYGLLIGMVLWGAAPNAPWWLALASMPWMLVDRRVGVRLVATGWLVMAILSPFYHPYARLWLPLHAAGWLIAAGLVVDLGPRPPPWVAHWSRPASERRHGDRVRGLALGAALAIAFFMQVALGAPMNFTRWPNEVSDGMRRACDGIARQVQGLTPGKAERLVLVARPVVGFYLAQSLRIPIFRQPDLEGVRRIGRAGDLLVADRTVLAPNATSGEVVDVVQSLGARAGPPLGWFPTHEPLTTELDLQPGATLEWRLGKHSLDLIPLNAP